MSFKLSNEAKAEKSIDVRENDKDVREIAVAETELKNDCACVTYDQSAGVSGTSRRENLDSNDSNNKFLM